MRRIKHLWLQTSILALAIPIASASPPKQFFMYADNINAGPEKGPLNNNSQYDGSGTEWGRAVAIPTSGGEQAVWISTSSSRKTIGYPVNNNVQVEISVFGMDKDGLVESPLAQNLVTTVVGEKGLHPGITPLTMADGTVVPDVAAVCYNSNDDNPDNINAGNNSNDTDPYIVIVKKVGNTVEQASATLKLRNDNNSNDGGIGCWTRAGGLYAAINQNNQTRRSYRISWTDNGNGSYSLTNLGETNFGAAAQVNRASGAIVYKAPGANTASADPGANAEPYASLFAGSSANNRPAYENSVYMMRFSDGAEIYDDEYCQVQPGNKTCNGMRAVRFAEEGSKKNRFIGLWWQGDAGNNNGPGEKQSYAQIFEIQNNQVVKVGNPITGVTPFPAHTQLVGGQYGANKQPAAFVVAAALNQNAVGGVSVLQEVNGQLAVVDLIASTSADFHADSYYNCNLYGGNPNTQGACDNHGAMIKNLHFGQGGVYDLTESFLLVVGNGLQKSEFDNALNSYPKDVGWVSLIPAVYQEAASGNGGSNPNNPEPNPTEPEPTTPPTTPIATTSGCQSQSGGAGALAFVLMALLVMRRGQAQTEEV